MRNSIHQHLSTRFNSDQWYDNTSIFLPSWQKQQLADARQKLQADGKNLTSGRMVAELHFGFWTGFFNKSHGQTGLGHALASHAFAFAPQSERDMKKTMPDGNASVI